MSKPASVSSKLALLTSNVKSSHVFIQYHPDYGSSGALQCYWRNVTALTMSTDYVGFYHRLVSTTQIYSYITTCLPCHIYLALRLSCIASWPLVPFLT